LRLRGDSGKGAKGVNEAPCPVVKFDYVRLSPNTFVSSELAATTVGRPVALSTR
jgi:hypothetical protein